MLNADDVAELRELLESHAELKEACRTGKFVHISGELPSDTRWQINLHLDVELVRRLRAVLEGELARLAGEIRALAARVAAPAVVDEPPLDLAIGLVVGPCGHSCWHLSAGGYDCNAACDGQHPEASDEAADKRCARHRAEEASATVTDDIAELERS